LDALRFKKAAANEQDFCSNFEILIKQLSLKQSPVIDFMSYVVQVFSMIGACGVRV
jgi:hypothetical protein